MLQDRIITYITKVNGLVSLEKLVAVATVAGFSELDVLDAIEKLGKKLKAISRNNTVYYQIAPPKKELLSISYNLPPYPREVLGESPFKICSCGQWHAHWKPDMGHFDTCEAVVSPDAYRAQNPFDRYADLLIDIELYEKEVAKQKAIRGRNTARYTQRPARA